MKNIFEGRWDIIQSERHIESGEWELCNQFEDGEFWWEFSPAELIEIEESLIFEGQITEHTKEFQPTNTAYYYNIDGNDHTLIIDRSSPVEDGFFDFCEEDCYSIHEAENRTDGKRALYLSLINDPDSPPPCFRYFAISR